MHYEHTLLALLQKSLMGDEALPAHAHSAYGGQTCKFQPVSNHECHTAQGAGKAWMAEA